MLGNAQEHLSMEEGHQRHSLTTPKGVSGMWSTLLVMPNIYISLDIGAEMSEIRFWSKTDKRILLPHEQDGNSRRPVLGLLGG